MRSHSSPGTFSSVTCLPSRLTAARATARRTARAGGGGGSTISGSGFGVRGSGFGFRVPGSGSRRSGSRVPGSASTGTERLRSSLQTCLVSNSSSSTPARATAAGKSRRMRARCREKSIARCARCRSGANSSCTAPGAPMPASTRSRRSRISSCTPTCRPNRCAGRSTTSCRPISTSAQSRRRRTVSTRGTTRWRDATCTRFPADAQRSASRMSGGFANHLDVDAMRAAADRSSG